jgi:hypothetical protein
MGLRCAVSVAFGIGAVSPAVSAQGAPTADSAQQFLATTAKNMVTRVQFLDAEGRTNYVTGKYTGDIKKIKGGAFGKPKETIEILPEKSVDKQLTDVRASVLEAIDAWGRPSACTTRITEVTTPPYDDVRSDANNDTRSFSWTLTYTNESWKYEPLTKFMSPAQVIDWRNVKFHRGADSSVTVSSRGQAFHTIHLTYFAGNPDQADRIEYAMKLLMMSCGSGAGI